MYTRSGAYLGEGMPFSDEKRKRAYCKSYGASWYQRNKERVKEAVNERRKARKIEWMEYKATLACSHCGASHPAIIDFHHPDQEEKEHSIFRLMGNGAYKKLREEIKKCVVLCANCHRKGHFYERQGAPEDSVDARGLGAYFSIPVKGEVSDDNNSG